MKHSEKVAADKNSLGFEFQDFVYIEKLIELRQGQSLCLELYDDIHVETLGVEGDKELLLIQVKHSIGSGNISDRDIDLWKTFDNWLKLIPELPEVSLMKFQLYTNKKINNQFFVSLLKNPRKNIEAILHHIRETEHQISKTESKKKSNDSANPIAKYVKAISKRSDEELIFLFENFEFHSDNSSIIARISSALLHLSIPATFLDETRKHVIGAFKESKFSKIIKGEKVVITYDNFRFDMGFDRIIRSARADPVEFDRFVDLYYSYQRPDKLSFATSKFHSQLQDIGVENDEIIDRGIEMILAEQFMNSLQEAGTFSASENSRLENKAVTEWQLLHRRLHRRSKQNDENEHLRLSLDCYDKTMEIPLKVSDVELPKNLSCGTYIKLSNFPRIGWRKDWQGKFKE